MDICDVPYIHAPCDVDPKAYISRIYGFIVSQMYVKCLMLVSSMNPAISIRVTGLVISVRYVALVVL